jgi:large subunit ribosomal protein L33
MAKVKRKIVAFKCDACNMKNYTSFKSKGSDDKIEKKKYCSTCQQHTNHKETKVKQ